MSAPEIHTRYGNPVEIIGYCPAKPDMVKIRYHGSQDTRVVMLSTLRAQGGLPEILKAAESAPRFEMPVGGGEG